MNGVRTTFMRRGYLLTALSALLLLAASAGTAWAQVSATVTLSGPRAPVAEGSDVTITVRGTATVDNTHTTAASRTATVELELDGDGTGATFELDAGGQVDDATIVSNPEVELVFPASSSATGVERTAVATVTIRTNHDVDAENETVVVALTSTRTNAAAGDVNTSFTVDDDETQTYNLALARSHLQPGSEPKENGSVMVTIEADPPHYDDGKTLTLHVLDGGRRAQNYAAGEANTSDPPGIGTSGSVGIGNTSEDDTTATDAENRRTIIVTTPPNDRNRVTDTVALEAHFGPAGLDAMVGSLDIDVLDIHMLPGADDITAVAKDDQGMEVSEIVEGGDPVYLTITVDRGRGQAQDRITPEALNIDIRPADPAQAADYDLPTTKVPLTGQDGMKQSNDIDLEIMLSARSDEDVGDEELVFNLVVSGDPNLNQGAETSTGTFSISIVDDTEKKIWPLDDDEAYAAVMEAMEAGAGDEGLNPGESFMVMTDDLFGMADGYTASYGVSVEGDPAVSISASTDSINIDANSAGESKVTVTATAKMASSSFKAEQTVSNVAHVTFPVTVVDTALKVTVAADPAEIDEGGTSEITATANRAVVVGDGDVVVDLEVLVGDAELDADSIVIAEGEMSGSVMLTAGEDDDYEDETVTVLASGSGIDGNMQVNIAVADTDMAPDALVVTLHTPEDVMEGNIVEGMSYDIMATANRAVTDDEGEVEVMIMRDRSKSDADDDDFEVTSATIMAGEDSATATLMVTEDDMPDAGHAMGEVLVLYGESDGAEVEGELMFTIWDEAVPALPLIAQLLLALFLMAGGARLYRRRQS